jgi:hypothetical protein
VSFVVNQESADFARGMEWPTAAVSRAGRRQFPTKIEWRDRGPSESVQFYACGNNYELTSPQSRSAGAIFPVQIENLRQLKIDEPLFWDNLSISFWMPSRWDFRLELMNQMFIHYFHSVQIYRFSDFSTKHPIAQRKSYSERKGGKSKILKNYTKIFVSDASICESTIPKVIVNYEKLHRNCREDNSARETVKTIDTNWCLFSEIFNSIADQTK